MYVQYNLDSKKLSCFLKHELLLNKWIKNFSKGSTELQRNTFCNVFVVASSSLFSATKLTFKSKQKQNSDRFSKVDVTINHSIVQADMTVITQKVEK